MKRLVQAQAVEHDRRFVELAAAHAAETRKTVGCKPRQTLHRSQRLVAEPRHVRDVRLRQDRVRAGEIRRQAVAARVHHDLFEVLCTRRRDRRCRRSRWRCGRVCCNDGIDARCCLRGAQPVSCEDLGCEIDSAVCLRLSLYAQVRRDQSRVVDEGQSFRAQLIEYVADRSAGERARPFGGMSRTRCSNYRQDAGKQAERDQYSMGELASTAGQEAVRLGFHVFTI